MKKQIFLFALMASAISIAAASKGAQPHLSYFEMVKQWPVDHDQWSAEAPAVDFKDLEMAKTDKTPTRSLAAEGKPQSWYESKMSNELKEARKEFLAVTTPDQLDVLLLKLDTAYDKFPTDLKFFTAQIVPLRGLRGVTWKMIPALKKTKILHSMLVTQVKQIAVNLKIYLPTDQWEAGFQYISEPYFEGSGKLAKQFQSEADFQGYMGSVIYRDLLKAARRIDKLNLSGNETVWDNQFLYGKASFVDAIDRYRLVGEVERRTVQCNLAASMTTIAMARAYSMEGAFKLNAAIGAKYGLDSIMFKADGVPSSESVPIIQKYSQWGTLLPDGKLWMIYALQRLQESVIYGQWMLLEAAKRPANEEYFSDTSSVVPYMRPFKARLDNVAAAIQGPKEFHSSIVNGDSVKVDVRNFFKNPPEDLKKLYAYDFNTKNEVEMKGFPTDANRMTEYRNYLHGRSTKWHLEQFQPYFPDVKTDEDLLKAARVLSQSWGGFSVLAPLVSYIQ